MGWCNEYCRHGHRREENGEFCVAVGPETSTVKGSEPVYSG